MTSLAPAPAPAADSGSGARGSGSVLFAVYLWAIAGRTLVRCLALKQAKGITRGCQELISDVQTILSAIKSARTPLGGELPLPPPSLRPRMILDPHTDRPPPTPNSLPLLSQPRRRKRSRPCSSIRSSASRIPRPSSRARTSPRSGPTQTRRPRAGPSSSSRPSGACRPPRPSSGLRSSTARSASTSCLARARRRTRCWGRRRVGTRRQARARVGVGMGVAGTRRRGVGT